MKILKGNLVSAPALGKLEIVEHGCLVLHDDGSIQSVEKAVPQNADAEVIDYGDSLIMPSFVDMHLHAPQYPMLGMGMDLPLIDWLNTYTFKTEARFEDSDYARRIYKKLASDLITSGTTRVCMFSSLHTDATLILMEELEKAGVTGSNEFLVLRAVIFNLDTSSINEHNLALTLSHNLSTRVTSNLRLDTGTNDRSVRTQQRNRLTHHVRSHQRTVSIIMFQERDQ